MCLPIDLTMEAAKEDEEIDPEMKTDYALALRERMRTAHQRARRNLAKAARNQKRTYDRRAEKDGLQVGKFVWCFNPANTQGANTTFFGQPDMGCCKRLLGINVFGRPF